MRCLVFFALIACGFSLSCKGIPQPNTSAKKKKSSSGREIKELGNSAAIIFQDSKNNMWFASDGAVKYDGKILTQFTTEDGLYSNRIRGFREDQLGNIYFDTEEGVSKFDGEKIEKLVVSTEKSEWKLKPNDLWFEGNWNNGGPLRYDGKKLHQLKLPKHELEEEFYEINPKVEYNPYSVYKTYMDSKGNAWFGTSSFGACRYDGTSFLWISEREMTEIDDGPSPGVRSIFEDKNGDFWFTCNVNSKFKLIEKEVKTSYVKLEGIETSSTPGLNEYFMSMTQDNDGNYWMARYNGGVWKYDGIVRTHYPINEGKTEVQLFSIYKDNLGILWLGTHNAGLFKFNGKAFERFAL